jgi:GT2 family glycosyltransferase
MVVAALTPTLHRPEGLRRVLQSLKDTAPDVVAVVACDPDDHFAHTIAERYGAIHVTIQEARAGCAHAWNIALLAYPDADAYILGSDDAIFTPGWYEAALAALAKIGGSGLVGFNDRRKDKKALAVHYMMTRDFIVEHHGGVMAVPHYKSWGLDTEACQRAIAAGKYIKCLEAIVIHDWRGPSGDDTYRMGLEYRKNVKELYEAREAAGFPDDFEPIIKKGRE